MGRQDATVNRLRKRRDRNDEERSGNRRVRGRPRKRRLRAIDASSNGEGMISEREEQSGDGMETEHSPSTLQGNLLW